MDGPSPERGFQNYGISFFNETDPLPQPVDLGEIDAMYSIRNAGGLGRLVLEMQRFNQNNENEYKSAIADPEDAITVNAQGLLEETTIGELYKRGYYAFFFHLIDAHAEHSMSYDFWMDKTPIKTTGKFSPDINEETNTLLPIGLTNMDRQGTNAISFDNRMILLPPDSSILSKIRLRVHVQQQ